MVKIIGRIEWNERSEEKENDYCSGMWNCG